MQNMRGQVKCVCFIKIFPFDAYSFYTADLSWIRRAYPTAFLVVFDPTAAEKPLLRSQCIEAGANMIAHDIESIIQTMSEVVIPAGRQGGRFMCPYCKLSNLSEREMWHHCPTYHINWPNEVFVTKDCPICGVPLNQQPLQVIISPCSS